MYLLIIDRISGVLVSYYHLVTYLLVIDPCGVLINNQPHQWSTC